MFTFIRRWLTKSYTRGIIPLLALVTDEPAELRHIEKSVRLELYKRLKAAEGQIRNAVLQRNTVMLEFAAVELITTLDVIRSVKTAVELEREAAAGQGAKQRRRASARRFK